jgi:hypothetical protein
MDFKNIETMLNGWQFGTHHNSKTLGKQRAMSLICTKGQLAPFIDAWILQDPRQKKPCGNARKVKLPPQTLQDKRHHHHGRPKPKTLAGLELDYNKGYELNQRIPCTPLCSLLAAQPARRCSEGRSSY